MIITRKLKKRLAKVLFIFYITVLCIPALMLVLVRMPVVQKAIIEKTTTYLSSQLDTEIHIGSITLNFFLDIVVNDFKINDRNGNLLASFDKLVVGFNDISNKRKTVYFNNTKITDLHFYLKHYEGEQENNLQFIIDYFTTDKKEDAQAWKIDFKKVQIINGLFAYVDENIKKTNDNHIDFNNLKIEEINFLATNVNISDTIRGNIIKLSFKEKSGFSLDNLGCEFTFCNTFIRAEKIKFNTERSYIDADIILSYLSPKDFNNFYNSVNLNVFFRKSEIDFSDISVFSPDIPAINTKFLIDGDITGTINNLRAEKLKLTTHKDTEIALKCFITGLPDIDETFFDLNISDFSTNTYELYSILKDMDIVDDIFDTYTFSPIRLQGSFIGFINSFFADFNMLSHLGIVGGKMSFNSTDKNNPFYSGNLHTKNFNIGKLLKNNMLGIISSDLHIKGEGINKNNVNITANGKISEFEFNNYTYTEISVDASLKQDFFNGKVFINDPNIIMDFDGAIKFHAHKPSFSFTAFLEDVYLNRLNFNRNDRPAYVSGYFDFNGTGNSVDNFLGRIGATDVYYSEGSDTYFIKNLTLTQDLLTENEKRLNIKSDILDGTIEGKYKVDKFRNVINRFVKEYITHFDEETIHDNESISEFEVKYSFKIKKFDIINRLFMPDLNVSKNTNVSGTFSSEKNTLFASISSENLKYKSFFIDNAKIEVETFLKTMYLTLHSNKIIYSDDVYVENFIGSSIIKNDNINFSLTLLVI